MINLFTFQNLYKHNKFMIFLRYTIYTKVLLLIMGLLVINIKPNIFKNLISKGKNSTEIYFAYRPWQQKNIGNWFN